MKENQELLARLSCYIHDWLLDSGYAIGTAQKINLLVNIVVVTVVVYIIDILSCQCVMSLCHINCHYVKLLYKLNTIQCG